MKISRKAEHAVRAAVDLTLHTPPGRGAHSSDIARRTGVPEKFLEAILRDLRRAGLVSSKRGPDGGHRLAQDPSRIAIGTILTAIDGTPTLAPRTTRRHTSPANTCVDALWGQVESAVCGVVDGVTLEDLRRQADALGAIDFSI